MVVSESGGGVGRAGGLRVDNEPRFGFVEVAETGGDGSVP